MATRALWMNWLDNEQISGMIKGQVSRSPAHDLPIRSPVGLQSFHHKFGGSLHLHDCDGAMIYHVDTNQP